MQIESWFKLKKYPHIGHPLTNNDFPWVADYVKCPFTITKHSFLPLIHKCIVKRKFRTDKSNPKRNPSGKKKRAIGKAKIRDTFFSAHLDSIIFSYYNSIISRAYDEFIRYQEFNDAVVAYRKIPVTPGAKRNKCNAEFAKSVFDFIQDNRDQQLSVVVADVTSFFDNLDHKILKKHWYTILQSKTLPSDHYNVFKALTRIKYVQSDQLFESYGRKMICRKGIPNSATKTEFKRVPIRDTKYFKEKKAVAYCTKNEFLLNNLGLVISKKNVSGIPQGNPLSATLANVYMLEFDQQVFAKLKLLNGFYQRYSDDLIVVCNRENEDEVIEFLREKIKNLVHLEISHDKTKVYRFEIVSGQFKGFQIDEETKQPYHSKTLEYLGFSFDGKRVLIKPSGFSKFYRSMKRSFRRSTSLALFGKNPDKRIFKSRLYKRFTYLGAGRKLIFKPSTKDDSKFVKTKEYDWGNYLSYIEKVNNVMLPINKSEIIKRQGRRFWRKFHLLMKMHQERVEFRHKP